MAPALEPLAGETSSNNNNSNIIITQDEVPNNKSRVTVVGSGNWGSVAAKLIASNTLKLANFHDEVRMWVYEEVLPSGDKLSEVINQTNENVKYLPGIKLGKNVVAVPDLEHAVRDANMLVFVTPHQFMEGICKRIAGKIREDVEAISLIKGMEVKREGPCMISSLITEHLGVNCCVLMGANIANEIAVEKFSEATVGYKENREIAEKWVRLFNTPYFMVSAVQDVAGVELCGTLKNVVALAAGFVDGLEMGNNTKAAIMRIGLREMKAFSKLLFSSVKDSTFFESCGVADLITTCLGGRNRKCAEAFARNGGKRSFDELEEEMLQRQKLQGLVVLHWGLGHSLKMDRLGLVGRHWSGMNIAGTEVQKEGEMILTEAVEEKNRSSNSNNGAAATKNKINQTLKRVRNLSSMTEQMSKAMLDSVGIATGTVMALVVQS